MIYEIEDVAKVVPLFDGWQETMIRSCLQGIMGRVLVTDRKNPGSALAFAGCFGFYAGEPDRELVANRPGGLVIMTPQNENWARLIEDCFPSAKRVTRYATKKDTVFDKILLHREAESLPSGYELRRIDADIYERCLKNPVTADFVSSFSDREHFLKMGRGVVILRDGEIVSGASSYSRYLEGIEIEVDTVKQERKKHLATAACSALILDCLDEGLYPSWDAQNMESVRLAQKLGYEFDHEYAAYVVSDDEQNRI